jgi:hypothetical protein
LPDSLAFTKDDHFAVNGSVNAIADLTNVDKINGLIRFVTNESLYYLYDAEGWLPESQDAIGWIPLTASENGASTRGNQCYLTSTKTPRPNGYLFGGCDCPIASLTENSTLDIPYGWESGTETTPIKIWVLNEDSPINNRKFILIPTIDGDPNTKSYFSENTTITPTAIIDYTTGVIDSNLSNVPVTYSQNEPFYRLTSQLDANKAIEFEVVTSAVIGNGQSIDFNIIGSGNTGILITNPSFGSTIYPENTSTPSSSKFFRCLSTLIEKGMGVYQIPDSINAYYFNYTTTQGYTGLASNTADQIVVLNAQQNGECRVIQNVNNRLETEAIRAIISTESGVQSASNWSNSLSLSANDKITISFSHPTVIRSGYPDSIAGNYSTFLIDNYIVELQLDGVSYFLNFSPSLSPENLSITTISGASSSTPTVNSDPDFGLFEIGNITISKSANQGVLPSATTAKVRIYQVYGAGTTLSKISHSTSLGCIPETTALFSSVANLSGKVQVTVNDANGNYLRSKIIDSTELLATLNNSGGNETLSFFPVYFRLPSATKSALKALSIASLTEGEIRVCLENNSPYIYKETLPSADDNDNYLESDNGTTEGWVKAGGQSGGGSGLNGWNAYATSSQSLTIPAENSTVTVTLALGTTDGMAIGQEWQLTDGTLTVFFQITNLSPLTFRNPTGKGNPTGTLNTGASVNGIKLISGGKGAKGDAGVNGVDGADGLTGSVSATSALVFDSTITPPTTSASEYKAFIDSSNSNQLSLRLPSNGITEAIAFLSQVKNGKLTGLAEGTATPIAATDTIIQALQKVQKYLTDYLTNFNGVNQLVKLDGAGKLPAIDGSLLINLPQPISIKGIITDASTEELFIFPKAGTITKIEYAKTSNASSSLTFKINSTNITGLSNLTISTTQRGTDTASGNNIFNAGDSLKVYNSGSDLTDLYFVIYYQFS